MIPLTRPLAFIDTETTGVETIDRIIEFGATVLHEDGTRKRFLQRFNPTISRLVNPRWILPAHAENEGMSATSASVMP
jgi:DNA polymerase III epsilon subunit-like protein